MRLLAIPWSRRQNDAERSRTAWAARGRHAPSRAGWAASLALLTLGALTLAGCSLSGSGGSSGSSITLGLSGATADNGGGPPSIATGGPSQTYAFVYNSQVWAHVQGASAPVQLTHLALSNGATLRWGPLVWSASNKYLAFALVDNLTPSQPTGSSGPLYYIDTTSCLTGSAACPVIDTAGVGSVYGHTYDWYQDDMLVYGSGQGLTFYDVVNPNNGPRVWQARTVYNDGTKNSIGDYQCGSQAPRSYGDVEVIGQTLFYTCMNLTNIGASDVVGSAILMQMDLSPIGNVEMEYRADNASTAYTRDTDLGILFNGSVSGNQLVGSQVIQLGSVYVDQQGDYIAGAWQVRNTTSTTLAYQTVNKVDTTKGTVASQLCESQVGSGGCDNPILSNAATLPLSVHPQFAISSNGTVALTADSLYIQSVNATVPAINWPAPAMWESGVVVFTQLVKETTDGSGVTRDTTNVAITKSGQTSILIQGGSNLAFQGFQS